MNIKRVYIYSIIILLVLFVGILVVKAIADKNKSWHPSNEILVTIQGVDMALQGAINTNAFVSGPQPDYPYTTEVPNPGHTADKVLITVDGYIMSLQDAVDNDVFVNGATQNYTTQILGVSHSGSAVEVSVEDTQMSLQDAIDGGKFVPCVENYGQSCSGGDATCTISNGTIVCDGTCVGASYEQAGTNCGVKNCDDTACRDYQNLIRYCNDEGLCDDPACTLYTTEISTSFSTWSGTCTNFCQLEGCDTAQVYGTYGSSLRGCSVCWGDASLGPYPGIYTDCAIIISGRVPICATQCRCSF